MPKQALPPLKTRLLVSAVGIAVFAAAWAVRPLLQQRGALLFEAKVQGCLPWQLYWYDKRQPRRPLRRGDIILMVNRTAVSDENSFNQALNHADRTVALLVQRGNSKLVLAVELHR